VDHLVLEYPREYRRAMDAMKLEIAHAHDRHNQVDDRLSRLERRLGLRDSDD
jgi:hypothetical protein